MSEAKESQGLPMAVGSRGIVISTFDELWRFTGILERSGLLPKGMNREGAFICIQSGLEIGLSAMHALQSVAPINGRPVIWGDAALALCKTHPDFEYCLEWAEGDTAWCEVKRRNNAPIKRSFSQEDAKRAGLATKPGPWQQYTARMRQMRARSFALRDCMPDALRGMGIREEVEDIPVGRQATVTELPSLAEVVDRATASSEAAKVIEGSSQASCCQELLVGAGQPAIAPPADANEAERFALIEQLQGFRRRLSSDQQEEMMQRAGIDTGMKPSELTIDQLNAAIDFAKEIIAIS
jgi:hypothetical protein